MVVSYPPTAGMTEPALGSAGVPAVGWVPVCGPTILKRQPLESMSSKQKTRRKPRHRHRVEWDDENLKREFEAVVRKGYLVVPTSRIKELEVCNLAFEPAGRIDVPECGHVIVRLKGT